MHSTLENGAVLQKTLDLCATIVSQPDFVTLRGHVDAFLGDQQAKELYQAVAERGEMLRQRQQQGHHLGSDEIAEFEQQRDVLLRNQAARQFIEAQEQMHRIQETVSRYVMKTLELGRVPNPEDFESCGHGCSCH